jgi:hypothetical protein
VAAAAVGGGWSDTERLLEITSEKAAYEADKGPWPLNVPSKIEALIIEEPERRLAARISTTSLTRLEQLPRA